MTYYLVVNGNTTKYDNSMAYYLEIRRLREQGYTITYYDDEATCEAVKA